MNRERVQNTINVLEQKTANLQETIKQMAQDVAGDIHNTARVNAGIANMTSLNADLNATLGQLNTWRSVLDSLTEA